MRRVALAGLVLVGLAGLGLALRQVYTSRYPGGNDLYPRWAAGCTWLETGGDPYSPDATLDVQRGIYGRPAQPEEDQVAFAYPIYSVLLTAPLCLTEDFATAHAIAMSALLAAFVLTALAARRAVGLRLEGRAWLWLVVLLALSYPTLRGILLGQLAMMVSLLQVAALLGLRRRADGWAGAALALSTVKPQMSLVFVPWMLLWAGLRKRPKVLAGFFVALGLLVAVPMIWLPAWPLEWVNQVRAYTGYTEFGSITWILTTYLFGTPPPVEWLVTGLWAAWMAVETVRLRDVSSLAALWPASLALTLTHFISPRTATTHFGSLLIPFFLLLRVWIDRDGPRAIRGLSVGLPLLIVAGWALFLATVQGRQESAWNYLAVPIGLLIGLVLTRRPWLAMAAQESG